ncbi:hypothetical protein HS088_TW09G01125 [Tripterygium wilfordii]|uniref:Uncharacterized protein n=1 Tax=Tripterygium wilfordii TaxID=458696 RepID=A0A7J7D9P7_TRIWF|nr:uncharacterized protein LOC120006336 [Tripterygium wilfordii]KAF5743063.1 hypothetical protein HS088_TW09G01125 [Tripterygium wilfordii]
MSASKSDPTISMSDGEAKAPNVFERLKEEIEAIVHTERRHHHYRKETYGKNEEIIDENTPLDDVKAPNVFERAKEEIEALVQTIHPKKESQTYKTRDQSTKGASGSEKTENGAKAPNLTQSAKKETERIKRGDNSPHRHHHETHGRSDDIDESTPISEVKGPNIFERGKEEVEALIYAIHPKKESSNFVSSPKKDGGFRQSIARGLEKVCSPFSHKKD